MGEKKNKLEKKYGDHLNSVADGYVSCTIGDNDLGDILLK